MKLFRNILLGILLLVILTIGVGALWFSNVTRAPLPQHEGTLTVQGLRSPVEVLRDSYGVPHIYATNSYDLFFAQGFTQAQDRWWQMAFSRAIGSGRIQELTGGNRSALGSDLFIRTIGWRRAAQLEYDTVYDEVTKGYLQAFADGVNAYIANRPAGNLALEYTVLGLTGVSIPVEPWTPVDSIVWGKVMMWDLSDKLEDFDFQKLADNLTPEQYAEVMPAYPFDYMPTIVEAEDLPEGVLSAGSADVAGARTPTLSPRAYQVAGSVPTDIQFAFGQGEGLGSNNWVVSGSRTASGTPLLANDPHLGIQMPSIWYEIGLHCQPVSDECPYDVRGYAFVPTPGIITGHNQRIAWGVTNVGPDVMDLYRIEVNPENPLQYIYDGQIRDMTVHNEVIRVGGKDTTYTIQVRETHLGPIINDNGVGDDGQPAGFNPEPVALRWTALDATQLFTSIVKLNRASNFEEFREAVSYFAGPSQNFVYADVEGNIGYQTPGLMPIRPAVNSGVRVLDGSTSETAWLGYIPFELLPTVYNPERGWIHSANEALVVPAYYDWLREQLIPQYGEDINVVIGTNWDYGYRGSRIVEMLDAETSHTYETFKNIQTDNRVLIFEVFQPLYRDLVLEDGSRLDAARDLLVGWDMQADIDSAAAAIWGVAWREITNLTFDDSLAAQELPTVGVGTRAQWAITLLLQKPLSPWWDDVSTEGVTETLDDVLRIALERAVAFNTERFGQDMASWKWGELHQAVFRSNPLGQSGIEPIESIVNRSAPASGSVGTVNAASWGSDGYNMTSGASYRMIVDPANWDASLNINTTGQSGHPYSPHYANLIPLWTGLQYKPMLYTREAVEAAAVSRLTLQP